MTADSASTEVDEFYNHGIRAAVEFLVGKKYGTEAGLLSDFYVDDKKVGITTYLLWLCDNGKYEEALKKSCGSCYDNFIHECAMASMENYLTDGAKDLQRLVEEIFEGLYDRNTVHNYKDALYFLEAKHHDVSKLLEQVDKYTFLRAVRQSNHFSFVDDYDEICRKIHPDYCYLFASCKNYFPVKKVWVDEEMMTVQEKEKEKMAAKRREEERLKKVENLANEYYEAEMNEFQTEIGDVLEKLYEQYYGN